MTAAQRDAPPTNAIPFTHVANRVMTVAGLIAKTASDARRLQRKPSLLSTRLRSTHTLAQLAKDLCAAHDIAIHIRGEIPRGSAILVANHVGYLDPLVISSIVPCVAIAKRELESWPLLGSTLRGLDVLLVDRANPASGATALRRAGRALNLGLSVLNFPEGTTSAGTTVLALRRGIFGLARLTGRPVIPVCVRYDSPDIAWVGNALFFPHYCSFVARPNTTVSVRFGSPMVVENRDFEGVAHSVRQTLIDHLQEKP